MMRIRKEFGLEFVEDEYKPNDKVRRFRVFNETCAELGTLVTGAYDDTIFYPDPNCMNLTIKEMQSIINFATMNH